jgi:RNA recognition motif-containing protein
MSSKVFVGNLSFKTREPDLAKAFEDIVGKVKSTNIIARGPRSLGYGFVEFEKAEDAAKSIGLMNKKEIDGRPVNVELARPRAELPPQQQGQIQGTGVQQPNQVLGQLPFRGPRRSRFPPRHFNNGPIQGNAPQQGQVQQPIQGQVQQQQQQIPYQQRPRRTYPPRQPMQQQPIQGGVQINTQQPMQGGQQQIHSFRPRFQRRPPMRRPQRTTGELSKTTLFVANLPFIVDDAGLLEIFEGMKVKEAHVVTRKDGHSKGYGFVTFENEADQMHAMQTVDKSLVEQREISVHQAFAQPPVTTPVTPVVPVTTTTVAPVVEIKPTEPKPAEVKPVEVKTEVKPAEVKTN